MPLCHLRALYGTDVPGALFLYVEFVFFSQKRGLFSVPSWANSPPRLGKNKASTRRESGDPRQKPINATDATTRLGSSLHMQPLNFESQVAH